jgi:hypothetical protein
MLNSSEDIELNLYRFLLLFVIGIGSTMAAQLGNCVSLAPKTLDLLLGNECTIGDKTFSDFAYSEGAAGADEVSVIFNQLALGSGTAIYKVTFEREGGWDFDFTLGYTVNAQDPWVIVGGDLQGNYPFQSSGSAGLTTSFLPGGSLVSVPGAADPPSTGIPGVQTVDVVNSYVAGTSGNSLATIENSFIQAVPEPGTYVLLGSGLLGLVVARRRRG